MTPINVEKESNKLIFIEITLLKDNMLTTVKIKIGKNNNKPFSILSLWWSMLIDSSFLKGFSEFIACLIKLPEPRKIVF